MVDFTKAIKRPFSDFNKLLIGIVLNIVPIINFIAIGYQLNCAKSAMGRKFDLPEWKDWGNLFIKGLLSLAIAFIYMLIPLGIMAVAGGAMLVSIFTSIATGASVNSGALLGAGMGMAFGAVLLLFALYILPMAIMKYVAADRFGSAFGIGEVLRKAFSVKYLVSWLVASIYGLLIVGVLSLVPIIGPFIGSFIAGLTAMTIFGQTYSELK
ncbi:MAG: DUF4013 domain-containing protein [Candidatus Aenigmarchaeota archaeon]|nr:DUF4013 domain-containing protein [Candidatus Aenigmarchaeota archaeon]